MLDQRCGRNLDDHVVDADLQIRIERVDATTHFRGAIHLNVCREKEVRYRSERRHQTLRHCSAKSRLWFVAICRSLRDRGGLEMSGLDGAGVTFRSRRCLGLAERGFDVFLDDASAWSTSLY